MRKMVIGIMFSFYIFCGPILTYGTIYYVDVSNGDDLSTGKSPSTAWKTLSKVGHEAFSPGDYVLLKRGEVWEEKLIIPSSGAEGSPIVFGAFGSGSNPKIKTTNTFSEWSLVIDRTPIKVWKGSMKGVKNSWGALRQNERLPKYYEYVVEGNQWSAPSDIADMANGFFYAPLNSRGFYFRYDYGNPGSMEIGARTYGIYISDKKYVTVDSIDVEGPGGQTTGETQYNSSASKLVFVGGCDSVIVQNCTLAHNHTCGAWMYNGSINCSFRNIGCYDTASTGLYVSEAGEGNKIVDCEVYNCGNLITDYGDMGLIGIWQSANTTIEGCFVHNNGHENPHGCDAGISFVQSPHGAVYRCCVKDTGDRSLQFAENSDYGIAAYNIFENWGVYGASITRWADIVGVRLGGGKSDSTAKGCKIYNNLFINGGTTPGDWGALKTTYQINDGTEIKNNIFYNNKDIYDMYLTSKSNFKNWDIKNNLFWGTGDKAIYWNGKSYDYNQITENMPDNFSIGCQHKTGSLSKDPQLSFNPYKLGSLSPCIDSGVTVGLNQDYYGNSVPSGNGVDIGPFEYQKGGLESPKNLRLQ
jgi:hypothetical protein